MINAAIVSQRADEKEVERLIKISKRHLRPLEDPFSTDFGLHRWLGESREESYSDWLAWVIAQLDNAAEVFGLFGLKFPPEAAQWNSTAAKRETPIPDGRLDIVLRWSGKALLVIEVKITDEASASINKQIRYRRWIDGEKQEPIREAILLAIGEEEGKSKGRFRRCGWRKVCLKLREMASRRYKRNAVRCALMLALAGAVEQNLLGMPGLPLDLMRKGHLLNVVPVEEYLKEFHRRVL
jgi:hypothetical protein